MIDTDAYNAWQTSNAVFRKNQVSDVVSQWIFWKVAKIIYFITYGEKHFLTSSSRWNRKMFFTMWNKICDFCNFQKSSFWDNIWNLSFFLKLYCCCVGHCGHQCQSFCFIACNKQVTRVRCSNVLFLFFFHFF